jgi:hypothetical protein
MFYCIFVVFIMQFFLENPKISEGYENSNLFKSIEESVRLVEIFGQIVEKLRITWNVLIAKPKHEVVRDQIRGWPIGYSVRA